MGKRCSLKTTKTPEKDYSQSGEQRNKTKNEK